MKNEKCPFKVGQTIVYRPSNRGHDLDANSPESKKLKIGAKYVIARIDKECYVVVENYTHPGGGIYWTEFSAT
jgi:hypothetical protein